MADNNAALKAQVTEHSSKSFGKNPHFISDTSAHSGLTGHAIKAIEDTIIAAVEPTNRGNTVVGETILAGDTWYFNFTSITLTSGAAWTYNDDQV